MKAMSKIVLFVFALFLGGCATTGSNPSDPYESFNRTMFDFNDTVDRVALKPAATVYQKVLPSFVQTGVSNFFGNLGDVWTMVNEFLQGKPERGLSDGMRVAFNSTIGIGGLLDIASEAGITKHKEDFGQTLGKWGVASGPYIVLPLLGPSTLRDTVALPVDIEGDLWSYVYPVDTRNIGIVVRVVDERASALNATNLMEDVALDPYTFVRGAYLQRRQSQVNDGEEPESPSHPDTDKAVDPQSEAAPVVPPAAPAVARDPVEPTATVETSVNDTAANK